MKEFMMFIGVIVLVIIALFTLIIVFSCCAISSRCSRQEEKEDANKKHRIGYLSDLEKEAVDNVLSNLTNEKPIKNDNI